MQKLKKIVHPRRRSRQEKEMDRIDREPVVPTGGFQHWAVALYVFAHTVVVLGGLLTFPVLFATSTSM